MTEINNRIEEVKKILRDCAKLARLGLLGLPHEFSIKDYARQR